MSYPVATSQQLRAVLRGLRQSRGFSQAQVGQLLGVNQKRAARIESVPGVTSFDQITRLVSALGGRLVVEIPNTPADNTSFASKKKATKATDKVQPDTW